MPTGYEIIIALKILVASVTLLYAAAVVAIATGHRELHGRINTVFFVLTMLTVAGFEGLLVFVDVKSTFDAEALRSLRIHLYFSVPSAVLLPIMYFTGRTHRKWAHVSLAALFTALWTGTFITGVFFLPHSP